METKVDLFQTARLCAAVPALYAAVICIAQAQDAPGLTQAAAPMPSASIPWSEIGAKAGANYEGDGLSVMAAAGGARLRCRFQRLEAQATTEGLWLTSTVTNAVNDRFRIVAAAIGREVGSVERRASDRLPAETSVQAGPSVEASLHAPRSHAPRLPNTGTVSIDGQTVRFTRPGLTEEYSVSTDGVRQDFVVTQRSAGTGELQVELAVTGARVEPAAFGAQLVLEGSGRKIAYSRLRVRDAAGRELPARMEVRSVGDEVTSLKSCGNHCDVSLSLLTAVPTIRAPMLAVLVNDADAVYPVRIDPTFSDANWISMGGLPGADRIVRAAVVDDSGNLYIGGEFEAVGETGANYIAKWNGSSWTALGSGMNSEVFALAASGSDLYAGGSFLTAGGSAANYIAKWNGSSWTALGSGMNYDVYALAVSGNDLYAGGDFTTAGGGPANYIARWNGSSWSALGSGISAAVSALAMSGTDLYAGGGFTTAGGSEANYIAKWNGSSWSALGSGMNGGVSALAVSGSDLYASGSFTTAGGKVSAYIAHAYLLPLPGLSVLGSGSNVIVSWPSVDTAGFTLEQAGTLPAPASWIPNTAGVTDDGTNKSVTLPASNSLQFFRLRRP
jgi:hypothetical protein